MAAGPSQTSRALAAPLVLTEDAPGQPPTAQRGPPLERPPFPGWCDHDAPRPYRGLEADPWPPPFSPGCSLWLGGLWPELHASAPAVLSVPPSRSRLFLLCGEISALISDHLFRHGPFRTDPSTAAIFPLIKTVDRSSIRRPRAPAAAAAARHNRFPARRPPARPPSDRRSGLCGARAHVVVARPVASPSPS